MKQILLFVFLSFLLPCVIAVETPDLIQELLSRVLILEKKVDEQQAIIGKQQQMMTSINKAHSEREGELLSMISRLEIDLSTFEDTVHMHDEGSLVNNEHGVDKRAVPGAVPRIAFHARIDSTQVTNIAQNQVIVFDVIMENAGNCYDNQHGMFTATHAGVYIFSTSVMSNQANNHTFIEVNIMKNGVAIARAHADGNAAETGKDQGSVSITTELSVGDRVWASLNWPAIGSLTGLGYTSFMGCLVAN